MIQPISIYRAIVKSVSSRNITVSAPILEQCDILVKPLLDGKLKLPAPVVNDTVLVFDLYSNAAHRFYLPISQDFDVISDDSSEVQIESESGGDITIEGGTINAGANSNDWVAMSSHVATELTRIKTELESLKILLTQHNHQFPPGSGVYTQPDETTFSPFTPAVPGSTASTKLKSEK